MKKFFFVLICQILSLLPTTLHSAANRIVISSQEEFNNLSANLKTAIAGEEDDIYVMFLPGKYEYKEQHISLVKLDAPRKSIHFVGSGAVLVPAGRVYYDGDNYEGAFNYDDSWMCGSEDLALWSAAKYADGLVEVLDAKTKRCRLKSIEAISDAEVSAPNSYILVTHSFLSSVYKIEKIENNHIYFTADDLVEKATAGRYNINNDFYFGKASPRYKLCNIDSSNSSVRVVGGKVRLPKGVYFAREGKSNRLLFIQSCNFKKIEITGLKVHGNSNQKNASAIYMQNVSSGGIKFQQCEFVGLHSLIFNVVSTPNLIIENNKFKSCYLNAINTDNASSKTTIKNNSFSNMGKRVLNSFCISCHGNDFLISGNSFEDFGYGGIACGVGYKSKKTELCTGIVEDNTLSYSQEYLDNLKDHSLMDSGAIYLSTKSDGIIIRNNRVKKYSGSYYNRGIFCDDGAYNFELYGNVITGITNGYCIDSWRNASVEEAKTPGTGIQRSNVNISIHDNIIDGNIRFNGNESADNGCRFGGNYILLADGEDFPKNDIKNVEVTREDVKLDYTGEKRSKVGLSRSSYKQVKKNKSLSGAKKFVARKRK